jgi:nucleotide-binding universal stress UspA family protein
MDPISASSAAQPPQPPRLYRRVLVVIEDARPADGAVAEGIELARVHGAQLIFLQLLTDPLAVIPDHTGFVNAHSEEVIRLSRDNAQHRAAELVQAAQACAVPATAVSRPAAGGAHAVVEFAQLEACDIIVVGCEDHNALVRLLTGSMVPGLITESTVPVLVCHESEAARGQRANGKRGAHRRPQVDPGAQASQTSGRSRARSGLFRA